MKTWIKKILCISLCVLVTISSGLSVVANAYAYPDGITQEQVLNAITGTDKLIKNIMPVLGGKDLQTTVKDALYSDETLSGLLIGTYTSFEEDADTVKLLGLKYSPSDLAAALTSYPKVSEALSTKSSWSEVDLTGVSWGVSTKDGFAEALGAIFSPFNDFLYCLLCSADFEINSLITIEGENGYQNAVVPILEAFQCDNIISQEEFTSQAKADKNSMVKNIALPVFTTIENALENPADNLSELLPSIAYFIDSGELSNCLKTLLNPITSNRLVELAVALKLFDVESLSNINVEDLFSSLTSGEDALQMAELDFSALASCGTKTSDGFVADKSAAYVEILRWLIETLKLNKDNLTQLSVGEGATASVDASFLTDILENDTDEIVKLIILLFNPVEPDKAQLMVYPTFTPGSVVNTTTLTESNLQTAYNEIDGLLDQFVKDGGTHENMEEVISTSLYTSENVNAFLTGIYKALEDEGLAEAMTLIGIDVTPNGVSKSLKEDGYSAVRRALSSKASWEDVDLTGISWGFRDGSRYGFQSAVTAALRPFLPILKVVLCEEELIIMDSITLIGSDGYNTSVIPILEALGCNSTDILDYESYKADSKGDGVITNLLNPVFALLDEVCKAPVKTLVDRLPNIIYFMESGSLEICISNLLLPLTSVINRVPGIIDLETESASFSDSLDVSSLLGSVVGDLGINMPEFDVSALATLGTATQKESKSVIEGKNLQYTYIEANETAIILSLLRIIAQTLKMPGNETLLMGSMGDTSSMSFDTSAMTSQFADMTEDELIAWLYNLFFKERVTVEIVTGDDYTPHIIYTPQEESKLPLYIFLAYLGVCAVVGIILLINRKRLYGKVED